MYEAVVIGASAGGMKALKEVLGGLPVDFPLPVAIVQHLASQSDSFIPEYLDRASALSVKEAEEKEPMMPGTAYLAPPDYHLLIEPDHSFSLSTDPRVNFSCPSIDVLFESAADIFREKLIGILLTGASADGSAGLRAIKHRGGLAIVQNPETAESPHMPQAAVSMGVVDHIVELEHIAEFLLNLTLYQGA